MLQKGLCKFSDEQARAILELRLQRLTAIGKEDIENEMDELKKNIEDYLLTLKSKKKVIDIIKKELTEIKDNFSIPRRTEIVDYIDDVQDEEDGWCTTESIGGGRNHANSIHGS